MASSAPKPCLQNAAALRSAAAREVDGRHLRQILGAVIRAEHEFDRSAPIAEIGRHGLLAGDVGLARGVVDGARGADLGGQEILKLALARITQADAHLLALRRRIDVDAARGVSLVTGLESGR